MSPELIELGARIDAAKARHGMTTRQCRKRAPVTIVSIALRRASFNEAAEQVARMGGLLEKLEFGPADFAALDANIISSFAHYKD